MRKNSKTHRATAFVAVCALFFAQSEAHAFLAINPQISPAGFAGESVQEPASLFAEKSLVETAMAPLQEPEFKIPQSVLAQFNPLGESGSRQSKIYYDASGRRVLRHEFSEKKYFEVYGQAGSSESGKIRGFRLGAQQYKFYYPQVSGRETVRIVFSSARNLQVKPYQAFEILEDGRLGRLLEMGVYRNAHFVRQRIYDYESGILTLNHPTNVYEKRVYELSPSGKAGRPVQYRHRTSAGEVIHIRFLYDELNKTVTCLHVNGLHYAVYGMNGSALGGLLEIGTAKGMTAQGKVLPKNVIELSTFRQNQKEVPVYIFRKAGVPGYIMRERSLEGSEGLGIIGRVLRYVGTDADFEYFYENRRGRQAASLTVLNRLTHERIRFELPEKVFDESQGRINASSKVYSDPLLAMGHELNKFFPLQDNLVFALTGFHEILVSYKEGHTSITFLRRLLRGPPGSDS